MLMSIPVPVVGEWCPLGDTMSVVRRCFQVDLRMGCDIQRTPGDKQLSQNEKIYHRVYSSGGGYTQFVHGCSRMSIDPRIPTMPGQSTSGFHLPGRHRLHQAGYGVRCSASRMKGELHPSKNRS